MDGNSSEALPLVENSKNDDIINPNIESTDASFEPKVYRARYWILFVFFLTSSNQLLSWVLWMPLSDALLIAYGWGVTEIGLANTATCATFVFIALPVMYLVEAKGIRVGVLIANTSLVVASILWNLSLFTQKYWLLLVGCVFSGISPTITFVLPSLLSVTWFPVSQRTTATSVSVAGLATGMTTGFIAGPYISGAHVTAADVIDRHNLTTVAGINSLGLILAITYFPASPPTPPSVSQTVKRDDFLIGFKSLIRNSQFWILSVAFNIPNALVVTWLPLLSVGFRALGISEVEAAWIGICSTIANFCAILAISLIADRHYFKRKTKIFLKIFSATSIVLLILLACIQMEYIPVSEDALSPSLYALVIGAFICTQCTLPLCSELACDYAFPVYEGLTCAVLMIVNWGTAAIFSGLLLIPALSYNPTWMTWVCVGGCLLSLPLYMLLKHDFRRLELDEQRQ